MKKGSKFLLLGMTVSLMLSVFSCATDSADSGSEQKKKEPKSYKSSPYQDAFHKLDKQSQISGHYSIKSEEYPYPEAVEGQATLVIFNYSTIYKDRNLNLYYNEKFIGSIDEHTYIISHVPAGKGHLLKDDFSSDPEIYEMSLEAGKIYYLWYFKVAFYTKFTSVEKEDFDNTYYGRGNSDEYFKYYKIHDDFLGMTYNTRPLFGRISNSTYYKDFLEYLEQREEDSDYNNDFDNIVGY